MSFKKLICLLLSLALALGLALPVLAEGGAREGELVILHTNDVHGRAVSANGVWGYAAITQVKKDLEAQGAQVLLLDEITSALDESNKTNVNEIIHRYTSEKNIAVLWVTHDSNEIDHADEVITLKPAGGRAQEEKKHERA